MDSKISSGIKFRLPVFDTVQAIHVFPVCTNEINKWVTVAILLCSASHRSLTVSRTNQLRRVHLPLMSMRSITNVSTELPDFLCLFSCEIAVMPVTSTKIA